MKLKNSTSCILTVIGIIVLSIALSAAAQLLESSFLQSLSIVAPCGWTAYAVSVYIFHIEPYKTTKGKMLFVTVILLVTIIFWLIDEYK